MQLPPVLHRTQFGHRSMQIRCPSARRARFQAPRAKLVLVPTGDGSTSHLGEDIALPPEIELTPGLAELGRDSPADIVVPVPTISGRHAMIRVEKNRVSITDLSSTNGTFIGDTELKPMQSTPLEVGQEVVFGDMFLARFRLTDRPEEASSNGSS